MSATSGHSDRILMRCSRVLSRVQATDRWRATGLNRSWHSPHSTRPMLGVVRIAVCNVELSLCAETAALQVTRLALLASRFTLARPSFVESVGSDTDCRFEKKTARDSAEDQWRDTPGSADWGRGALAIWALRQHILFRQIPKTSNTKGQRSNTK